MWKQFLHILQIALCLPLFPLIGIPAGGDGGNEDNENEQDENAEDGGEGGGDPDDNESPEDDEQETVTMTKKELEELVNKKYRQGARNAQRKAGSREKQHQGGEGQETAALLQKANDRLLAGTVKSLAGELGITAKGANAALKLMDFAECFDKDGDLNEDAVKDLLEDFKDDYPEFKPSKEDDSGTGGTVGAKRKKTNPVSGIGARLAKEQAQSQAKSSFFK